MAETEWFGGRTLSLRSFALLAFSALKLSGSVLAAAAVQQAKKRRFPRKYWPLRTFWFSTQYRLAWRFPRAGQANCQGAASPREVTLVKDDPIFSKEC